MLYILLPVFNRSTITQAFANQLKEQSFQDFTLVLIDDNSSDDTIAAVTSILPGTIVLYGGGNSWWGGSLQLGYDWILQQDFIKDEDIVLIINDDTKFENNFLQKGAEFSDKYPDHLIKAVEIELNDPSLSYSYIHADVNKLTFKITPSEAEANCCTTRGLFMKADVFKKIGGFFPDLLPHYLSDYEYTIRAYNKGFRIKSFSDLFLYYDNSTTGHNSLEFQSYSQYKSQLFSNKYVKNPKHWINFIKLTSDSTFAKYKTIIILIVQTFKNFIVAVMTKFINRRFR